MSPSPADDPVMKIRAMSLFRRERGENFGTHTIEMTYQRIARFLDDNIVHPLKSVLFRWIRTLAQPARKSLPSHLLESALACLIVRAAPPAQETHKWALRSRKPLA